MNDLTTTLQSIRDYCDAVLTHATPGEPEPASRMVARRVRELATGVLTAEQPVEREGE